MLLSAEPSPGNQIDRATAVRIGEYCRDALREQRLGVGERGGSQGATRVGMHIDEARRDVQPLRVDHTPGRGSSDVSNRHDAVE